jgi:uncharacterized repeat protein (TIGR03803 family)
LDGDAPWAGLTLASDGNLYGTTVGGGPFGHGVVFRLTLNGTFAVVHGFTGGADGAGPDYYSGELASGADGNLYGATSSGAFGQGTLFRMTLDGTVTTLKALKAGPDGAYSTAQLVQASDGFFYGTTTKGGAYDAGTIFRIAADGSYATLYEFTRGADGGSPAASLIEGPDGSLYGTTPLYGAFKAGTVFQLTRTGNFKTLHAFSGADGANPQAALLLGRDGKFYGTTFSGGAFGHGTVFTMASDGVVNLLHSFPGGPDGAEPAAPLIQGADGVLYGTASSDGSPYDPYDGPCPNLFGTVFSISTAGSFRTLHVFDGTAGGHPTVALLQAKDGNFYGTTSGRCAAKGTILRMTANGNVTVLQTFASVALIQASDGSFYGAGEVNESYPDSIFRMTVDGSREIVKCCGSAV